MHVLVFQQVGTFLCVCVCVRRGRGEREGGTMHVGLCLYGMHTCEIFIMYIFTVLLVRL